MVLEIFFKNRKGMILDGVFLAITIVFVLTEQTGVKKVKCVTIFWRKSKENRPKKSPPRVKIPTVEIFLFIFCFALFVRPHWQMLIRFHDPFAFAPCFGSFPSFSWPLLSSPFANDSCLFFQADEKICHFFLKKT